MEALVLDVPKRTATVKTLPIPSPSPTQLLVRTHFVALNPVDALYVSHPLAPKSQTRIVGSDFAGTVQQLGSSIPASARESLKIGTHVAGFLQGACSVNERPGAFAKFIVVDWDLVWRVPGWMGLESAAGVSLCALTAAQGLFARLGVEAPFEWDSRNTDNERGVSEVKDNTHGKNGDPLKVFIYGASTSLGQYAAQLVRIAAHASGREAVLFGAASPARHAMLKVPPYSYNGLVDYREANWVEKLLEVQNGEGVQYAFDCISEGDSVRNVIKTVAPGGKMAVFRSREGKAWAAEPGELPFEPVYGAVWEGLGVEVQYQGFTVPASASAREFAVNFYGFLSSMTEEDGPLVLRPNLVRLMPGGLERIVPDGFALLGPGSMDNRDTSRSEAYMRPISAEKLVYQVLKQ
ncbi:GroES-like protein [Venustampulla echinocandica]|uniref:GroES-like protein n=1 Tax=Venustampulla echinocandica TaxID=2656787 RepID=A0A370T9C9_9HELO|nr:GroES-like protein [Venustampulla echinocandica]RDL30174.1 GroES-like protein [Venustampulla echinocandica]